MSSVYQKIFQQIKLGDPGSVYVTNDFIGLANRASLDKALSALTQDGVLQRLTWGIYHFPKQHSKLGALPPDLDAIMAAIQRQSGDTLQIDGAKAANMLGLSTQVPAQIVLLTSGHSREISIGNWRIKLKHASPKTLVGAGQITGHVLQAIRYLGKNNINTSIIKQLKKLLSKQDKKQLQTLIPYAPGWTHKALAAIAEVN